MCMIKIQLVQECVHTLAADFESVFPKEGREGGREVEEVYHVPYIFLKSLLAFATVSTNIFQFCAFRGQVKIMILIMF